MTICVGNQPQLPCRYVGIQQIIILTTHIDIVSPYLYVLLCNFSNITSNCICKSHNGCGWLPTRIAM